MTFKDRINKLSNTKHKSIMSASIVLGITFTLSALLGFLRTRILYDHFFVSNVLELDAFNAAFRLPDLIFKLLVSGAISASFIPVYSSFLAKDKETANKVASSVVNLLFIVFIIASILIFIFAAPFSQLIAHGFSPYQVSIMANFTRILLLAQIFFLISNFVTSILQVNQIFLVPALSPLIYNIVIILSIYFISPFFGLVGVAWGTVFGAILHLLIQIPSIRRQSFNYYFLINTKLAGVKEVVRLMIPQTFSIGVSEIKSTVILSFASLLIAGSISLLNLAMQLMYLPSRIFSTTVGQASLPVLSKKIAENKIDEYREIVVKTIMQSLFLALPIAVLLLVLRLDLVRIVFGSRHFPWTATKITALTLGFLTPVIVCQAIVQIIVRAFYAIHNTKIPLISAILSLIICLIFSFYSINYTNLGIAGLALGTSLGDLSQCIVLVICFGILVKNFDWQDLSNRFLLMIFTSTVAGFCAWMTMKYLDNYILNTTRVFDVVIVFGISSFVGLFVYLLSSYYLHINELNIYLKQISKLKHFISRK
jgi:putative peptidoglycan lipid II flippase